MYRVTLDKTLYIALPPKFSESENAMRGAYERPTEQTFQPNNQSGNPATGQLTLPEMPWQRGDLAAGAVETSLLPQDRELVSLRVRSERKDRRQQDLIDHIEREESYSVSWAWRNPRVVPIDERPHGEAWWDNKRKRWLLPHR